jgi:type I restriction enzyme M protein
MLAPHIKKNIDELWNRFWAAGLTNPLVAVEQITYLLFLKRLEDIDHKRQRSNLVSIYVGAEGCRWSHIRKEKDNPAHLIDTVFPWLRELDKRLNAGTEETSELTGLNNRMADAYFQLDPNKGQVLSGAIDKIDELFARAGEGSTAQDVMGDTFEYLLSEVATAGKNGQFRTPRHLIRFMVELLDPEPGQRIIDPAAGTGGFLFSAQQYLLRKYSTKESLCLEWDGTPHRADCAAASDQQRQEMYDGAYFVGLDNDRTMARIGWMNLVLHELRNPHLLQGDSLSKRDGKPAQLKQLLTSQRYDYVLANPPFTGTVDTKDLETDVNLLPRAADRGKKKDDPLTNKSELLFLWLMLDLLKVDGRCAVVIPEGVLFGNTEAHIRLRRELLTEHVVEGVVSLPPGMFQPYTGVKTSVLVFRKKTHREDKQKLTGSVASHTTAVWFYEVEEDGFSVDAKRSPRPGQRNDLWDALVKFKAWRLSGSEGALQNKQSFLQPLFHPERWRQALLRDATDKLTPAGEAFLSQGDIGKWDGRIRGIHELFPGLPRDPQHAEVQVEAWAKAAWNQLVRLFFLPQAEAIARDRVKLSQDDVVSEWRKRTRVPQQEFMRAAREVHTFFEKDNSPALEMWKRLVRDGLASSMGELEMGLIRGDLQLPPASDRHVDLDRDMRAIAREVAKIDGFDVTLRTLEIDQKSALGTSKHWVVPVRSWARNDEWKSDDGEVSGSHDSSGIVRSAYVQAMLSVGLYDEKGHLRDGLLDPECIEARDWNLSAGQYKPFDFPNYASDRSVAELIGELKATEHQMLAGLDELLAMVEGRG